MMPAYPPSPVVETLPTADRSRRADWPKPWSNWPDSAHGPGRLTVWYIRPVPRAQWAARKAVPLYRAVPGQRSHGRSIALCPAKGATAGQRGRMQSQDPWPWPWPWPWPAMILGASGEATARLLAPRDVRMTSSPHPHEIRECPGDTRTTPAQRRPTCVLPGGGPTS